MSARNLIRLRTTSHLRGQALIEYMLIASIVAIVMFVPDPLTENMAPADYFAKAVQVFFRSYSFLVSTF